MSQPDSDFFLLRQSQALLEFLDREYIETSDEFDSAHPLMGTADEPSSSESIKTSTSIHTMDTRDTDLSFGGTNSDKKEAQQNTKDLKSQETIAFQGSSSVDNASNSLNPQNSASISSNNRIGDQSTATVNQQGLNQTAEASLLDTNHYIQKLEVLKLATNLELARPKIIEAMKVDKSGTTVMPALPQASASTSSFISTQNSGHGSANSFMNDDLFETNTKPNPENTSNGHNSTQDSISQPATDITTQTASRKPGQTSPDAALPDSGQQASNASSSQSPFSGPYSSHNTHLPASSPSSSSTPSSTNAPSSTKSARVPTTPKPVPVHLNNARLTTLGAKTMDLRLRVRDRELEERDRLRDLQEQKAAEEAAKAAAELEPLQSLQTDSEPSIIDEPSISVPGSFVGRGKAMTDEDKVLVQQDIQESLATDILSLVATMKSNAIKFRDSMATDTKVLSETSDALEQSATSMGVVGKKMSSYRKSAAIGWMFYFWASLGIFVAVVAAMAIIRLFPKW